MAAHSDASVDNAVKVIDANLVCASIKLRIEHIETLRSLIKEVKSEDFSAQSGNSDHFPHSTITWNLALEFSVKMPAADTANYRFRLDHKGELPPGTKVEYTVHLLNAAGQAVHTQKRVTTGPPNAFGKFLVAAPAHVKRALHADGSLLVECNVRYVLLEATLKPSSALSRRHHPDDSTRRDEFRKLFTSGLFADFTIKVGDESIPAHKGILAQRSAVFRSMLSAEEMCEAKQASMTIHDFEPQPIKAMLEYIYTGSISESKKVLDEWAESLLAAADQYAVLALKELVESHLASSLNAKTLAAIASLADTYSAQLLKEACTDFVAEHYRHLVGTPEWQSLRARKPDLVLELSARAIEAEGAKIPPPTAFPPPSAPAPAPSTSWRNSFSAQAAMYEAVKAEQLRKKKWYKKLGKLRKLL